MILLYTVSGDATTKITDNNAILGLFLFFIFDQSQNWFNGFSSSIADVFLITLLFIFSSVSQFFSFSLSIRFRLLFLSVDIFTSGIAAAAGNATFDAAVVNVTIQYLC